HLDDGTPIHVTITIPPNKPEAQARGSAVISPSTAESRDPLSTHVLHKSESQAPLPAAEDLDSSFRTPHSAFRNSLPPAATIDFPNTGPIHSGNPNANPSIVTAAVIYVLRLLINEDIPLNQGVLSAVELIIPPGLLNPAANLQFAISNLQSAATPQ